MKSHSIHKRARAALIGAAAFILGGQALAEPAPEKLTVAMYAPAAPFADSSARLAYIQGLAKAVQQKTGLTTTGKIYVRLGDLLAAKPDFAIVDGQCLAAQRLGAGPQPLLAQAVIGGDTAQAWGLYTRGGETLASLKGKKLAYVNTGCRDNDFLDNAMLEGEVKTAGFFGGLVDRPDVTAAIATVRDYKAADAVFAPAAQARGLTKVYDAVTVPNAGLVALRVFPGRLVDSVKEAALGYGGGGGIEGWRGASPSAYSLLGARLGPRHKRPVFAPPEVVRLDDADVLVMPQQRFELAPVKQHFWLPIGGAE
jgi:hypothetical protein